MNLIVKLYTLQITSSREVASRVAFLLSPRFTEHHGGQRKLLISILQARFNRWIAGQGHPPSIRGTLIDEEAFDEQTTDPLLRPKCFVAEIAGIRYLPLLTSIFFLVCLFKLPYDDIANRHRSLRSTLRTRKLPLVPQTQTTTASTITGFPP